MEDGVYYIVGIVILWIANFFPAFDTSRPQPGSVGEICSRRRMQVDLCTIYLSYMQLVPRESMTNFCLRLYPM